MLLRVLAGGLFIANAFANRTAFVNDVVLDGVAASSDDAATINVIVDVLLTGYGVWLAFYLVLAWLVVRGVNWARIASMLIATASLLVSFVEWWQSGLEITLRTTLLSVALDILILLALSSQAARAFARTKRGALAEKEPAPAR